MIIDSFASGLLARLPQPARKVVVLGASRIGDFLCATPALRALRIALPDAQISMIAQQGVRDLACHSPYIDRVLSCPGLPDSIEPPFDARATLSFLHEMQEEQFDLAIQMQGCSVYANAFTLLLGARACAGFIRSGDAPGGLDAALPYPSALHEIRRVQALTTFLGASTQGDKIEFPLWPQDHATAEELLQHIKRPLIGLHPSAHEATRCWLPDRFAELANRLQQRYEGTIVLLGDDEALESVQRVQRVERQLEGAYLNLVNKTSLVVLGAIIARLSVLVTNDSGLAHIAYALDTPTVTIFGAGDPQTNGPFHPGPFKVLARDVLCRPCGNSTCPIGYLCLDGVSVKNVFQATGNIMR
ncbi:MAG: glycosyltransferase family 9 protein [Ktedonobacteraceae bacterium]